MEEKEVSEKTQKLFERARNTPLPCVQPSGAKGGGGLRICGKPAIHTDGQWIYCGAHAPFLDRPIRFITDQEHVALVLAATATPPSDSVQGTSGTAE